MSTATASGTASIQMTLTRTSRKPPAPISPRKHFRTWAGTVLAAALALQEFEAFDSEAAAKRNITRAIEQVAGRLGNTVSICRKCYVHPEVLDAYLGGSLAAGLKDAIDTTLIDEISDLTPEEVAVLAFLQRRLDPHTKGKAQ